MSRTPDETIQNVADVAEALYAKACANERSDLVGAMVTSLTFETADAKQLAIDMADVVVTLRALRRMHKR